MSIPLVWSLENCGDVGYETPLLGSSLTLELKTAYLKIIGSSIINGVDKKQEFSEQIEIPSYYTPQQHEKVDCLFIGSEVSWTCTMFWLMQRNS